MRGLVNKWNALEEILQAPLAELEGPIELVAEPESWGANELYWIVAAVVLLGFSVRAFAFGAQTPQTPKPTHPSEDFFNRWSRGPYCHRSFIIVF